jgi:hypothetical protein
VVNVPLGNSGVGKYNDGFFRGFEMKVLEATIAQFECTG